MVMILYNINIINEADCFGNSIDGIQNTMQIQQKET